MKKKLTISDYDGLKQAFLSFSKKLLQIKGCEDVWDCFEQKYELNLNILFLCCFLPLEGFPALSKDHIKFIVERARPWRDKVILPLRKLYQTVFLQKKNRLITQLADLIKRNIMLAEQVEQSFLLQVVYQLQGKVDTTISPANRALGNLFEYIRLQGLTLHNNDFEKVYRLVNSPIFRPKASASQDLIVGM